ncbi:pilin [Nocardia sp. NPDC058658]|uniref:pilin n=1 Tax=unclassified Nocardia TaxID=2637762 RepID=UPI003668565E
MRINTFPVRNLPNQPNPVTSGRDRSGHRRLPRLLLLIVATVFALVWVAGSAAAQPDSVLAVAGSFEEVLNNLRNWLVGILAALATVCLTIGGVRYLVGAGDPSEIEKAKLALKGAAIGYGLAVLAPVVVEVLKSIVGG